MLKIGISACFFHSDPMRAVFKGKTLLYAEQSLVHWIQSQNGFTFLIPTANPDSKISLNDLANEMDGLVLQGGSDVSPESYGEKPLRPEWNGDAIRDRYEIELFEIFRSKNKPILGICRGAQLINVALGGTLFQDIQTQIPHALNHRNWDIYDQNFHSIQIEAGTRLQKIYSNSISGQISKIQAKVNSIHHQALKDIGKNLMIEARSVPDGLIEAIRLDSDHFVSAVQWHPEFHHPQDTTLLNSTPILADFLSEVQKRKDLIS